MPKYGISLISISPYMDRMVSLFSRIWKIRTRFCLYTKKYGRTRESPYFSIFHAVIHIKKEKKARNSNDNSNFDEPYPDFLLNY